MKRKINNKSNNSDKSSDNSSITVIKDERDIFALSDMFNNEVQQSVITVDMSRINQIDVMKDSRISFFRKCVKSDISFNMLANYDYKFYNKTNDRSKTRHADKYVNNMLSVDYVRMRTAKQLRDVLKEKDIVAYLNRKYNKSQKFYTVVEYKTLVK